MALKVPPLTGKIVAVSFTFLEIENLNCIINSIDSKMYFITSRHSISICFIVNNRQASEM